MPVLAETPAATKSGSPPTLTAADLEPFLSGLVPLELQHDDIAGAVVAVVNNGQVLFEHGYGYADYAKRIPVSPETTLFRPGSISKLFTWTSVMQLEEQGKLNLDRDVNAYLDFSIPPAFGKPITLRDLMTHTPGFEEFVKDLIVTGPRPMPPLGPYLRAHLPRRIFPPGEIPAYSNYGAALAGYIVQRVSGEPFSEYVVEHIFEPLGMAHSTFLQPLPAALRPLMSQGYLTASGGAKPFEMIPAYPAGGLSTSGDDIARFMLAQLGEGRLGATQILRPETARLMQTRQYGLAPEMPAMCLGFYEESRNGHRIIGHGGDTIYFHSDLHLIPDAGVGFFVSYNSAGNGAGAPRTELWRAFLDRYFPYAPPPAATLASAARDDRAVSGDYMTSRRTDTTLLRIAYMLSEARVTVNADRTISLDAARGLNGKPLRWREIAPGLYREARGQQELAFLRDPVGRQAIDPSPIMELQRVPWWQSRAFNVPLLVGLFAILLLAFVLWPVAAVLRRHYGRKLVLPPGRRRLRIVARCACLLDVVALAGWLHFLSASGNNIALLSDASNGRVRLWQVLTLLGVIGTIFVCEYAAAVWFGSRFTTWVGAHTRASVAAAAAASDTVVTAPPAAGVPSGWVWGKLAETLVALAALAFVWFVLYWHLLAFSLRY